MKTLAQFLGTPDGAPSPSPPSLGLILERLARASRRLAREISRAALSGRLGAAGGTNVTGDQQKKMDVVANQLFIDAFAGSGLLACLVSEEMEEIHEFPDGRESPYLLCMDPFDGSSNMDVNGSVGTIFGVYERKSRGKVDPPSDVLRPGSEQIAAGYVLYGTSTVWVHSTGNGVNGFTLDADSDQFLLTHPNMRCPGRGRYYSANLGNMRAWSAGIQGFAGYMTEKDKATGRPYSLRYTGALVTDVHRLLIDGGIYLYPADSKNRNGKLRLLYECAPLGYVVEQAGGAASTGDGRILDVKAEDLHQRTPIAIGSVEDVRRYERFHKHQS